MNDINITKVLKKRDNVSDDEAQSIKNEMRERIYSGENPEDVLMDEGLEMDYFEDLF